MKKYQQITEQTKKNLFESFWQLYKNDDKITISKICKLANYDRSTFYRYFIDIKDISNQFEDELLSNLRTDIKTKTTNFSHISPNKFKKFTDIYGKYIIVYFEKGNRQFYEKFKSLIIKEVYDLFDYNIKGEEKKNFLYEFTFSSIIISYAYWYNHQEIMDFENLVEFMNNILLYSNKNIIKYLK